MDNILIIQTAFLGDVILTTPLVSALRKSEPQVQIDVMAIPIGAEVWKNNPHIRSVWVYDKNGIHKKTGQLFRLISSLKKKKYDWVISPHRSIRSAFISYGTGAKKRTSFDKSAGSLLFYNDVRPYRADVHEIQRNLDLINITDNSQEFIPEIFPSVEEKEKVNSKLIEAGIKTPFVAISPGSVWYTKKWPEEYYRDLVIHLKNENIPVVFIGGPKDRGIISSIMNQTAWGENLGGLLNPRESFWVIKQSSCLVCNDSAPLHMASGAQTPSISIFGATIPEFGFGPYGSAKNTILQKNGLSCRPCGIHGGNKCPIDTFECMISIKPVQVLAEIKERF